MSPEGAWWDGGDPEEGWQQVEAGWSFAVASPEVRLCPGTHGSHSGMCHPLAAVQFLGVLSLSPAWGQGVWLCPGCADCTES